MSLYQALIDKIKLGSVDIGVSEMARRANMSDDAVRRIVKNNPPDNIARLKTLEEIVDKHKADADDR